MPSNLYGPFDNFDLKTSHVLPAILRKTHEAEVSGTEFVEIWGSGSVLREFLHVDDLADACLFLLKNYNDLEIVNIGSGSCRTNKGSHRFQWGFTELGWKPKIGLRAGVESTYAWYLENLDHCRNS